MDRRVFLLVGIDATIGALMLEHKTIPKPIPRINHGFTDPNRIGPKYGRNLDDRLVVSLAKSMSKIGLMHPILLDSENHYVIDGCHRLMAARLLGWKRVEVAIYPGDSREYERLWKKINARY